MSINVIISSSSLLKIPVIMSVVYSKTSILLLNAFHLVSTTFVVKMAHRKLITVDVMSFPKEKIKAQFQSRFDNLVEYRGKFSVEN
jgi:hypothetical protein